MIIWQEISITVGCTAKRFVSLVSGALEQDTKVQDARGRCYKFKYRIFTTSRNVRWLQGLQFCIPECALLQNRDFAKISMIQHVGTDLESEFSFDRLFRIFAQLFSVRETIFFGSLTLSRVEIAYEAPSSPSLLYISSILKQYSRESSACLVAERSLSFLQVSTCARTNSIHDSEIEK